MMDTKARIKLIKRNKGYENAKQLIRKRKYNEARTLLKRYPDHPRTVALLEHLNNYQLKQSQTLIREGDKAGALVILKEIGTPLANQWVKKIEDAKRKKTGKMWGNLAALGIIVATLLILSMFLNHKPGGSTWKGYEFESRATLGAFCSVYTSSYRCTQWANEVIAADERNGWEVNMCELAHLTGAVYRPQQFADCLGRAGIYLP